MLAAAGAVQPRGTTADVPVTAQVGGDAVDPRGATAAAAVRRVLEFGGPAAAFVGAAASQQTTAAADVGQSVVCLLPAALRVRRQRVDGPATAHVSGRAVGLRPTL